MMKLFQIIRRADFFCSEIKSTSIHLCRLCLTLIIGLVNEWYQVCDTYCIRTFLYYGRQCGVINTHQVKIASVGGDWQINENKGACVCVSHYNELIIQPLPAEQVQPIETREHKCYSHVGEGVSVEGNYAYFGLCVHSNPTPSPCPLWWAVTPRASFSRETLFPKNNCIICQRLHGIKNLI